MAVSAVEEGYRDAARVVRRRARNFAFAFVGQPAASRRALHAVYAFCREADDAADDGRGAASGREALAKLRGRLDAVYGGRPALPRDLALQDAVRRFGVARDDFDAVLEGVEQDLEPRPFDTFEGLYGYCFRVGASVGLLCLPIFGRADARARRAAVDLGIGMQLTNILRDVAEDAAEGRLYIPLEELSRFGLAAEDVLLPAASRHVSAGSAVDGGLRGLLEFQASRAAAYLERGKDLLPLLSARQRFCPAVLADLYGALLGELREVGPAALQRRVGLSVRRKTWIAVRAWIRHRWGSWG